MNCPNCGAVVVYQGMSAIECNSPKSACINGVAKEPKHSYSVGARYYYNLYAPDLVPYRVKSSTQIPSPPGSTEPWFLVEMEIEETGLLKRVLGDALAVYMPRDSEHWSPI